MVEDDENDATTASTFLRRIWLRLLGNEFLVCAAHSASLPGERAQYNPHSTQIILVHFIYNFVVLAAAVAL